MPRGQLPADWLATGQAWDRSAALRESPKSITLDNGAEFTCSTWRDWAYRRSVKPDYTQPGKQTDNSLIELFNRRLRDQFLNVHEFIRLYDLQEKMQPWQHDYKNRLPHGSLGHLTP